jgi:hypothetical protein
MNKVSATLNSRNFFVTLISMVLIALQFNSIEAGYTADGIYDLFKDVNLTSALVLIVINFLNPIIKIVNKVVDKTFSWAFIKSQNFTTQVLSMVTIVLSIFLDEVTTGLVSALILNVWNLVSHILQKDKNDTGEQQLSEVNS